jgi:murein L,D-transpeptidase YafK
MLRAMPLLVFLMPGLLHAQQVERHPSYLLQVPDSVPAIFVAETDTSTLHRFSSAGSNGFDRDERYMSVGERGVGKQQAWDRRTPLGIYFVSEQLDTGKLHDKYGPLAFPLDYPNAWDRANGRSGDGIWIHGVTPGEDRRPPFDTDGCIALPNEDLLALEKQFVPMITPVLVTRSINWVSAEQLAETRDSLNSALQDWLVSLRDGDLYRLLSIYAEDFSYRGMNRSEWEQFRVQSVEQTRVSDIIISDVLLLEDPEEPGLYLSRFHQAIIDGERSVETIKRLYWHRDAQGAFRIVAEDNG